MSTPYRKQVLESEAQRKARVRRHDELVAAGQGAQSHAERLRYRRAWKWLRVRRATSEPMALIPAMVAFIAVPPLLSACNQNRHENETEHSTRIPVVQSSREKADQKEQKGRFTISGPAGPSGGPTHSELIINENRDEILLVTEDSLDDHFCSSVVRTRLNSVFDCKNKFSKMEADQRYTKYVVAFESDGKNVRYLKTTAVVLGNGQNPLKEPTRLRATCISDVFEGTQYRMQNAVMDMPVEVRFGLYPTRGKRTR